MDNLFPYPIARQSKTPPNYDMANLNDTLDPQEKTHPQADQASAKTWVQVKLNAWAVPAGLLALLIVSFGLFIPRLGFYWDDWPVILTGRLFGASGFWQFYQYDRPFSAWTYILTFPILGSTPIRWHIFTLLLRWGTSLALWWTLIRLWPGHRREGTWAAFLFAIYPVFTQQSISVAYSQHWICYFLYFISLGTMIQAYRLSPQNRRWFWPLTALSLASSLLQLFTMEYFVGLELLRPIILWILAAEKQANLRQRAAAVFRTWLPYLLALSGFVLWRLFILKFPDEEANPPVLLIKMLSSPLESMLRFPGNFGPGYHPFAAHGLVQYPRNRQYQSARPLYSIFMGTVAFAISAAAVFFFFQTQKTPIHDKSLLRLAMGRSGSRPWRCGNRAWNAAGMVYRPADPGWRLFKPVWSARHVWRQPGGGRAS